MIYSFFYSFCFLCWFIFGKLVRLMLYLIGQYWVVLVIGRVTTLFWSFSSCGLKKTFSKHLCVLRSSSWPIFGSFGIFEPLFYYFWVRWYQKSFLKVLHIIKIINLSRHFSILDFSYYSILASYWVFRGYIGLFLDWDKVRKLFGVSSYI